MRAELQGDLSRQSSDQIVSTLDAVLEVILGSDQEATFVAIDKLCIKLNQALASGWSNNELAEICGQHRLAFALMLDPYTARATNKPRGYAGDAVMLDFIYRPSANLVSGIALNLNLATTRSSNAKSILWRQRYLSQLICECVEINPRAKILSVASGHMRELDLCVDSLPGSVQFTAIDLDNESLSTIRKDYPSVWVEKINTSVKSLLFPSEETEYDLIYSAGLFDYLDIQLAERLLSSLHKRLARNGILSIGNFRPDNYGRGFMEAIMDWSLVCRTEAELVALSETVCNSTRRRVFSDPNLNVAYLELRKPPTGACAERETNGEPSRETGADV